MTTGQTNTKATNIVWHDAAVSAEERWERLCSKPCVLWYTGLSGSGKSTLANAVDRLLHDQGYATYLLDGDNIRHGLNKDLGFTDDDRIENIRRITEVSQLFNDAGLIVSTAFISPFVSDRQSAREIVGKNFIEIFVDTPLDECEKRDPKGLYKKARAGEIPNFTGIDSPYEPPVNPELHLQTTGLTIESVANQVVDYLVAHDFVHKAS
ncbi:adenylyl-sulfate kinase [Psychrobacter sp. HD31]|uniref:adenylyl-sulfate kinase n=1 Tax=Psychrobacter sp. HD31 TaxID=3112003 RepID=UPI003DA49104